MKLFLILTILLYTAISYSQDSTFRCANGRVEVKRIGLSKIHKVEGKYHNNWISTKVKRINYEYMYTRTYHGSTQPANPAEFYKPIKRTSFYFIPVDDVIIKYNSNGQVFQSLSMDSLTLRTYRKDGTPQEIVYLNEELQADSIVQFYENGNVKTKVLGGSSQPKENLELSLRYRAELTLRKRPIQWVPDARWAASIRYLEYNYGSNTPSYPKKQYFCHGNGVTQLVISWFQDTVGSYYKEYAFFDPNGNPLDSNRISRTGAWTGVKHIYYDSGMLKSVSDVNEDRKSGKFEYWNSDGTLNHIEYSSKFGRDSIVYHKKLKDTLLTWRPPMHFKWNKQDTLIEVSHKHCKLGFDNDGSVRFSQLDGSTWELYRKYRDERMQLEHFGTKDELGFPHGEWVGVNALKDTVYKINYHHGWLHGSYQVSNSYWENNWSRMYDMGLEIDSSIRIYKGHIREIQYFSEPGELAKKAVFGDEGRLQYVDSILNGKKFFRLRGLHSDGWDYEISRIDTLLNQIHTKRFFAPDSLEMEFWTDYRGNRLERKEYHRETGTLMVHWKNEGMVEKIKESSDPAVPPKQRWVKLSTRCIYDENGRLIKKERLENGVVVD